MLGMPDWLRPDDGFGNGLFSNVTTSNAEPKDQCLETLTQIGWVGKLTGWGSS